jgi:hypothetical protein
MESVQQIDRWVCRKSVFDLSNKTGRCHPRRSQIPSPLRTNHFSLSVGRASQLREETACTISNSALYAHVRLVEKLIGARRAQKL